MALERLGGVLGVPRSLAGVVLLRVSSLSPAARELVVAAAVLGCPCELAAAATLAGLGDPLPALGEAVAAGILVEQPGGAAAGIRFSHLLVQRAVYGDLNPARRRGCTSGRLAWSDRDRALGHRVAAAVGPDDGLAGEVEAAGGQARRLGRTAQAAAWLAQAAAVSSQPEAADRRLLDALEILVTYGEVAEAEILAARVATAGPSARRSGLLGALDFFAGRAAAAEARLLAAWQSHDRARDASVGAAAATQLAVLCLVAGRIREAIEWGERAASGDDTPAAMRHLALGLLAIALFADGRGPEGLARLAFLPAAPSEVPREDTDALVLRGLVRVRAEDLAGAIADLSTAAARLRAGVPLRNASQCLSYLAGAEYRLGSWDDAVVHGELAVSLAQDADRVWDLGFVHGAAAIVPALRGDWEVASAHVRMATEAAQASGAPWEDQRGRHRPGVPGHGPGRSRGCHRRRRGRARHRQGGVLPAPHGSLRLANPSRSTRSSAWAAWTRRKPLWPSWRRPCHPAGPPSAMVAAARLRGDLAAAAGHQAAATAAFDTAWRRAEGLRVPLAFAQLEISDGRRLRAAGQREASCRPAALRPAAPDHPRRPALRRGLRPGTRRRRCA